MHCVENKNAPPIFLRQFFKPCHPYPTSFLAHNFLVPTLKLKKSRHRVSIRDPEQHFDSTRKNPRKSSKIPDYYKGKTSFNDK